MNRDQVLILDCHGETKPAICFSLEVAEYSMRVVIEEDEALNLLDNSRITNERYIAFLVNNPYLNVDISKLVEEVERIDPKLPVLFVKDSKSFKKMVQALSLHCRTRVHHTEPTRVVDMLNSLRNEEKMKSSAHSSRLAAG